MRTSALLAILRHLELSTQGAIMESHIPTERGHLSQESVGGVGGSKTEIRYYPRSGVSLHVPRIKGSGTQSNERPSLRGPPAPALAARSASWIESPRSEPSAPRSRGASPNPTTELCRFHVSSLHAPMEMEPNLAWSV